MTETITFLGRPALSVTLGTGSGNASGTCTTAAAAGGERSHKRSRAAEWDDSADPAAADVQQAVRAMLRAHKLGVLVPLVYHCDTSTGAAIIEAVPGRRLADLIRGVPADRDTSAEAAAGQSPTVEAGASAASSLDTVATALGRTLARLHDGGQVHGSLSGETVTVRDADGAVVLTDFRRSFNTIVASDKAEDLAGLEVALLKAEAEAHAKTEGLVAEQGPAAAASEAGAEEGARAGVPADAGEGGASSSLAAAAIAGEATAGGQGGAVAPASSAAQLFEKVLSAYRAASRLWSATHNKLPEARARRTSQLQSSKRAKTTPAGAAAAVTVASGDGDDAAAAAPAAAGGTQ